jgi:Uma2 family endonuclease
MTAQARSMPQPIEAPAATLEEYFAFEIKAEGRHEFVDGKIVAMAYTSEAHGKIASNLNRLLGNCLLEKACDVYSGDRMLYIKACNQVFYPDLLVVCGEHSFYQAGPKMKATLNPSVVIEILSDSTEQHDKTNKTRCYKKIPGLQQIVFLSQKEQHVRILENEAGKWIDTEFYEPDDVPSINGCDIPLHEIYRRVVFEVSEG